MTDKITDTPWHTMQIDEIIVNLATNVNAGLNLTEVEDRLRKYGHNQLEEKEGVSPVMLFLSQFNDFIVWVLIAAAVVSGFMGEWVDALAIVAIVIINVRPLGMNDWITVFGFSSLPFVIMEAIKFVKRERH